MCVNKFAGAWSCKVRFEEQREVKGICKPA